MKKFVINNVEFCNFGSNNYSEGMELITCYPMPDNMVEDVLAGKYHGVYLNPSAPCSEEFYGVFGTSEQYKKLYAQQKESQISKMIVNRAGGFDAMRKMPLEEYRTLEEQCEKEYKDWWIK